MILLAVLILVFFLFSFRRPRSAGLLLLSIYVLSLACNFFIQQEYSFRNSFEVFNVCYLALMIGLMIVPWMKYQHSATISEPDPEKVKTLTYTLFAINGFVFLLFGLICFSAFSEVTDFTAFKNGGESAAFIDQLPIDTSLNRILYLLASYVCSTAYFLVPLHFYYLVKEKYLLAAVCLLLSTNIVLFGLTSFSRSVFMAYGVIYLFHLPFFFKKLSKRGRRVLLATTCALAAGALIPFARITANRFSTVVAYNRATSDQTLINAPEVYSLVDYAGQWYRNSADVMSSYTYDTLNGELNGSFILTLGDKFRVIDYPPEQIERSLYSIWGDRYDRFNGLIANLLFDFGYVGTTLFVIGYALIVRKLAPVQSEMLFHNQLIIGALFILPAAGIFNSELKTMTFDTLVFYSIIVYWYMKSERGRSFAWSRRRSAPLMPQPVPQKSITA